MTKEQAESCYKEFILIADAFNKSGDKIPCEEASQQAIQVIMWL